MATQIPTRAATARDGEARAQAAMRPRPAQVRIYVKNSLGEFMTIAFQLADQPPRLHAGMHEEPALRCYSLEPALP